MFAIAVVLVILIGGGLLGGLAGYLTESLPQPPTPPEDDRRRLKRHLILGLVASACVPLFLSILQSSVLTEIFTAAANAPPVGQYFVLVGFCLLAAFFSRNFLDTLAAQVLKKAEEAQVTAQEALAASADAVDKAVSAIEIVDEPADGHRLTPAEMQAHKASVNSEATTVRLTALEESVLSAMMTTTYRTASGIAAEINKTRGEIAEVLNALAEKNLVERTVSPKTGSPRWRITSWGVNTLG